MSCAAVFRDLNFDKTLLTFEGGVIWKTSFTFELLSIIKTV